MLPDQLTACRCDVSCDFASNYRTRTWDQWYPEAARLTALAGARIIFYPTAIGWLPDEKDEFGASQHAAWETMMRSHAIA
ncbi:MAG TPA: hypothetical protein VJL29_14395, partial [Thermoguttaceae bacterium]|nr:hypothetical protein [Thermoguttaceae bacterium]